MLAGARADEAGHAAQHALEIVQRRADREAVAADPVLADGGFVRAGALLDDRDRAAHLPHRLEVAQQDHRVGEVGHVDRRPHVAHEPVLGHRQEGRGALPVEVLQQLMDMQDECVLLRHRGLITVEAVDHHRLDRVLVDADTDPVSELTRRQLGRVDLLDEELALPLQRLQVMPHGSGAVEQKPNLLIEDK